jgi:predicted DsbA family dithiol-disulfide isomerase
MRIPAPPVRPGTVQVWSDLLCPFAYVGLLRFYRARTRLGLDGAVWVEHRAFPVELFDGPHPRRATDSEVVGVGRIEPEAEFRLWSAPDDRYPHTVLLAAEAVIAAGAQSTAAGEALDLALRRAFWTQSRTISHRQVILDVAAETGTVDVKGLTEALDEGRHRADLMTDFAVAQTDAIAASPTFRLADGTVRTNPGIEVHWEGPFAKGYPVIDSHDPSAYDDLLTRAASH